MMQPLAVSPYKKKRTGIVIAVFQPLWIFAQTKQLSLIFQTCFDGTFVIFSVTYCESPLNLSRARCYKVRNIAYLKV